MPDNDTMVDLITQFRMKAYEHCPYLAPYVYSLTPVERPGLGTMAVDKYARLYYDPAFCEQISVEQGGYVVLHEAYHLVLRHCHRAPTIVGESPTSQEQRDLNIAYDIIVWEMMEAIASKAPPGGVTFANCKAKWPAIERNMVAEQLYAIINESRHKKPRSPALNEDGCLSASESSPSPQGGTDANGRARHEPSSGDQEADGNSRGEGGDRDESPIDSDVANDGFEPMGGGSAADGVPRDYEEAPDSCFGAFKEDRLLEMVEAKIEEIEQAWRGDRGTIPTELKRVIRRKLHPQPNPWKRLRATAARVAANHRGTPDYTYSRRNRRQDSIPGLPLLKATKRYMPRAVVGVDSSGSMSPDCLRKAIGVIQQGLKVLGEVPVITCDATVGQDIKVTQARKDFQFKGGGGTDMRVLLDYAEKEHRPDVVVLVTDGATPWPNKPTRHQLVIALTQECPTPDWATTIRIPNDPTKESLDDE